MESRASFEEKFQADGSESITASSSSHVYSPEYEHDRTRNASCRSRTRSNDGVQQVDRKVPEGHGESNTKKPMSSSTQPFSTEQYEDMGHKVPLSGGADEHWQDT